MGSSKCAVGCVQHLAARLFILVHPFDFPGAANFVRVVNFVAPQRDPPVRVLTLSMRMPAIIGVAEMITGAPYWRAVLEFG
jgi:hypothetical protein